MRIFYRCEDCEKDLFMELILFMNMLCTMVNIYV